MVLVNDWSARDIQKWEYAPLGPFLAKNFGTSISPWVVMLEALAPYRTEGPSQEPPPLPYLRTKGNPTWNVQLEVRLQGAGMPEGATDLCLEFAIPLLECPAASRPSHLRRVQSENGRFAGHGHGERTHAGFRSAAAYWNWTWGGEQLLARLPTEVNGDSWRTATA